MTVTSIIRVPEVGEVGAKATFRASGEKVGTELRYYLTSAPVNSKAKTLANVATTKTEDARLQIDKTSAAYFTPDVPGHYQVEVHDVTVTTTPRKYADAPFVPDTDNDFSGAPSVNLNTAEALSRYDGQPDFQVVETKTRTLGRTPDTLTIAIRTRDEIETKLSDAVTITPSPSPIAQVAAFDDRILGVRDLLREGYIRGNPTPDLTSSSGEPPLLQVDFARGLMFALDRWQRHVNETLPRDVHLVADAVNDVATTEVTTLAGALTRLASIRAAYDDHRVSATFHLEDDDRNVFPVGTENPTDLPTGIAFARLCWQVIVHGTETTTPLESAPGVEVFGHMLRGKHVAPGNQDPIAAMSFDFSSSLVGLLRATNELTAIYNAHIGRVTQDPAHSDVDTHNLIQGFTIPGFIVPTLSPEDAAPLVNQLVECIERHTAGLNRSGEPLASAVHQNARPLKLGVPRATDAASTITALEMACAAMEQHALDGGHDNAAHVSPVWGGVSTIYFTSGIDTCGVWPAMTRAQLYIRSIKSSAVLPPPDNFNTLPIQLAGLGWK